MNQLAKLYPEGWLLYCPDCSQYVEQSDPQNDSRRKSVVIDDEPCAKCKEKSEQEILEAQEIMGRLGLPKENTNE
jgi:hypothetical protein